MHSISLDPAVEAVDGVADSIEVPQFAELIPTAADPVSVEVKVTNITRQDLHVLESALSQWVLWHRNTYQEGYPSDAQLFTGSIGLDGNHLRQFGLISWIDKLAPVAGPRGGAGTGTASYEQEEAPPLYDRAVSELLAPVAAPSTGISMLPGGTEAAKRRAAAEACYGTSDNGPLTMLQGAVKRRKLPDSRCFNCGSYAHALAKCLKPMDQGRISAARAEQAAIRRPCPGFMAGLMRQRYFSATFGEMADGDDVIRPGKISSELAEALGMSSNLQPPPWLSRMAVLGVPPRYLASSGHGLTEADDHMSFINGSEDEGDEIQGQDGAESSSKSDASPSTQGQQDPADADFVPWNGKVVQQQEKGTDQQQHDTYQDQTLKQAFPGHMRCLQQFPGINAPLPDGAVAAAWHAELDKAVYLSRMLQQAA